MAEDVSDSPMPEDNSASAHAGADMSFSEEELSTCIKVLECLKDHMGDYRTPRFRQLRKSMLPFLDDARKRIFEGEKPDEYTSKKMRKLEQHARKQRQAAMDSAHIQKTELRLRRIAALETLKEQAPVDALEYVVPDGPALAPPTALPAPAADSAGEAPTLQQKTRSCYTCKARFTSLHHFYDQLCPACADFNFAKRMQTADLRGRIAIITGGRVKIGFHSALKLLRAGAHVVITTRFPQNGIQRFQQEADFAAWQDRIELYGLDMRDLPSVEAFCDWFIATHTHLDILVNNACQTVRRPPAFYRHLISEELQAHGAPAQIVSPLPSMLPRLLDSAAGPGASAGTPTAGTPAAAAASASTLMSGLPAALLSQVPILLEDRAQDAMFPAGASDVNGQQIDLRRVNSWKLKLGEVSSPEAAECFAINSLAPFILNGRLKPAFVQSPKPDRYIINVSAMEGKFYRFKTPNHPHTNMAKAALNMMTRTSSADYAESGIYMNSVDTGWINDENPAPVARRIADEHDFQTPIDEVDAAARVLDPVFRGEGREHGRFFKDYKETEW